MAIALVAATTATPGASGGTTAALDTTGATLLVVSVASYGPGGAPTITDSKGNTYTGTTARGGSLARQQFFYAISPVVGSGHTFTIGAGFYPAVHVYAFTSAATYQVESGAEGSTSPLACGSVTPSLNGALVLAALAGHGDSGTDTLTPSGFTYTATPFGGGVNTHSTTAYLVQATAAAVNPTWSWVGGGYVIAAASVVVFTETPSTASARLSQIPVEVLVLSDAPVPARLSQLPLEVLHSSTLEVIAAQLSQLPLEVLLQEAAAVEAQLSQLALEVLLTAEVVYASDLSATQLVTELAEQQPGASAVTQMVTEVAHQQLDSAIAVTQVLIEVARDRSSAPATALDVTQVLIEIIRVLRPTLPPIPPVTPPIPPPPPTLMARGPWGTKIHAYGYAVRRLVEESAVLPDPDPLALPLAPPVRPEGRATMHYSGYAVRQPTEP